VRDKRYPLSPFLSASTSPHFPRLKDLSEIDPFSSTQRRHQCGSRSTPEYQQTRKVKTPRTSFGSFGLGASIPAMRFSDVERESGRKGADRRKQFAALFDDSAKRKFDCVWFWALDRFSREGMAQTIAHLQRLVSYGIAFHSYTEPHLATDNELVRNILLALLSSLAKLEAQKISERTKAGMARAKANGIKIGRPKLEIEIRQKIMQRAKKGETPYPRAGRL
jgi:Resolvase, N terminal domain